LAEKREEEEGNGERRVNKKLGREDRVMWLKCHWTQGNAVPAPPVIDIQRSHTSNFIERVQNHLLAQS